MRRRFSRGCGAAGPGQRFVPVRSVENQAELMRHRGREFLAGQRTSLLNALRGHMAEIGIVAPQGTQHAQNHADLQSFLSRIDRPDT